MNSNGAGKRIKIVRRRLADGSLKEYRYDLHAQTERQQAEAERDAIHKIALEYTNSPEFRGLSPAWQKATRAYIATLEDELGYMTFKVLADRRSRGKFYALRDSFAATPVKADRLIGVLKVLTSFAYERGTLDADHARGIPRLGSDRAKRSDFIWTQEHDAAFLAVADSGIRQVYLLALYTAARQSDLIGLTWDKISSDGWLSYQPSKTRLRTGVWVHLPTFALPPLRTLLEECPRTQKTILETVSGIPWTVPYLKKVWRATKAKAGITEDLRFHDLRGTAVTRMLEAGCTDAEVASITGHALVRGVAMGKYAARTRPLALNAYTKWAAAMEPGKVVSLHRENGPGK